VISDGNLRRNFWARFFSGSVATNLYAGKADVARAEAQRLAEQHGRRARVSSGWWAPGPGAEDLLTLRAQRLLQEADVIVHDALVPGRCGGHGAPRCGTDFRRQAQGRSLRAAIRNLRSAGRSSDPEGLKVVRLKAGDPMIFGRAAEEMEALRAGGIGFEIVPGVTAAFAAAASAQIPLTLRGVASNLVFATGHNAKSETLPDWAGPGAEGRDRCRLHGPDRCRVRRGPSDRRRPDPIEPRSRSSRMRRIRMNASLPVICQSLRSCRTAPRSMGRS
jgi:uroporphyrin-III C-methyltransferase/precorrin-2 dehydrogenase/sirohydrochlorin ferrochelatase